MRIKRQPGIIAECLDAAQLRQLVKIEPVLLIHGTYANALDQESAAWWMPGSSFARQLDVFLEARASAARCWADLRLGQPHTPAGPAHASPRPFAWTGENSEAARRNGGRALAAQITALERDSDVARYHLVGHSHGGNVILNALGELPRRPAKLGAVVFLGTTVLRAAVGGRSGAREVLAFRGRELSVSELLGPPGARRATTSHHRGKVAAEWPVGPRRPAL